MLRGRSGGPLRRTRGRSRGRVVVVAPCRCQNDMHTYTTYLEHELQTNHISKQVDLKRSVVWDSVGFKELLDDMHKSRR